MVIVYVASVQQVTNREEQFSKLLDVYEQRLIDLKSGGSIYALLNARDRLATALRPTDNLSRENITRALKLDSRLREALKQSTERSLLKMYRDFVKPPKIRWWWYEGDAVSPLWTVAAVLFLTITATLLTDFAHRLLSSNPDELGIASIAFQAMCTVAAGSTFTETGEKYFSRFLRRFGIPTFKEPKWRLGIILLLFIAVFCAWRFLPLGLARMYNNRAYYSTDPDKKDKYLNRAIALDPQYRPAHFSLGSLYEGSYQYDQATAEYQKAIAAGDPKGFNNLARLQLLNNKPLLALRITNDALSANGQTDQETQAALLKNKAWAEFALGFLPEAEADARRSVTICVNFAPSYCILAKTLQKENKVLEAQRAWTSFLSSLKLKCQDRDLPASEPDCILLAQRSSHE